MRKIKSLIAVTIVLAMAFSTVVMAAPSPTAGVVTVVVPGKNGAQAAQVKAPTQKELTKLASFIAQNAATVGMTPTVVASVGIVAPADYKGGDIPTVLAAAGLANGAKNVFAYLLLPNGKTIILPCSVKNGYVGFVAPAFGTVSIVVLNPSMNTAANATTAAAAAATAAVPAKLH